MAMYTALPPVLRRSVALSSPSRSFHCMLSVGIFLRRDTTNVAPSLRFANSFATKTSADDSLIHVLESEINCAHDYHHLNALKSLMIFLSRLRKEPYNLRDNIRMKL